jgi:hypothetical protein
MEARRAVQFDPNGAVGIVEGEDKYRAAVAAPILAEAMYRAVCSSRHRRQPPPPGMWSTCCPDRLHLSGPSEWRRKVI